MCMFNTFTSPPSPHLAAVYVLRMPTPKQFLRGLTAARVGAARAIEIIEFGTRVASVV